MCVHASLCVAVMVGLYIYTLSITVCAFDSMMDPHTMCKALCPKGAEGEPGVGPCLTLSIKGDNQMRHVYSLKVFFRGIVTARCPGATQRPKER